MTNDAATTAGPDPLRELVALAGHDLREPLRKISSFLALLTDELEERLEPDSREMLRYAVDGAVRGQHLLERLELYVGIDLRELAPREVDPQQVVTKALDRIEQRDVEVELGTLEPILADPTSAKRILEECLSNAFLYRQQPGGWVRIRSARTGDTVCLTIEDDGLGIDPRFQEQIFEPLKRLHGRGEYPGCGLGLAIARREAERTGGHLTVES